MRALHVSEVGPEAAADVLAVIGRAFGARPPLEPPSTALDETRESVADRLAAVGGVLVRRDGDRPVGALLLDASRPGLLGLRRVSVDPAHQGHGVASAMVGLAEDLAEERGLDGVWLTARAELPDNVTFWLRRDYVQIAADGSLLVLAKSLWVAVPVATATDMRALGTRLATLVRGGDLLVLTGGLGAGKTTLTQGIGTGLGVRGAITSPTFVIAREHGSTGDGPGLVHVDAYRLGGLDELDDLDLDATLAESVTVVEWGAGLAEGLADAWLEIRLDLLRGGGDRALAAAGPERGQPPQQPLATLDRVDTAEVRVASIHPYGPRWAIARIRSTLLPPRADATTGHHDRQH